VRLVVCLLPGFSFTLFTVTIAVWLRSLLHPIRLPFSFGWLPLRSFTPHCYTTRFVTFGCVVTLRLRFSLFNFVVRGLRAAFAFVVCIYVRLLHTFGFIVRSLPVVAHVFNVAVAHVGR